MLVMIFNLFAIAWLVSEVILGFVAHGRSASAVKRDRGSLAILLIAAVLGFTAGNVIRFRGDGPIGIPSTPVISFALALLLSGLAVRWTAILTLGRSFTVKIAIQPGQRIVRRGVYRYVRHPAYSGLLMIFLGLGLSFDNWLSLLVIVIPVVAAVSYRVHIEEKALGEILGSEYADYCAVTKRLIPGVY